MAGLHSELNDKEVFKVGSRKSQLALIQTEMVIEGLRKNFPGKKFEIVTMMTTGDKILDKPLPKIGEKSLFTKELEAALENYEVDFVVHSLKDLPTVLPSGLTIGAVLEREDPRDALISKKNSNILNLKSLPKSSVVGTSSLRRVAQLSRNYPHIVVENIRGNVNTRLKKLDEDNKYSAIILAAAGVKRMKLENRITQLLEPSEFLYAVGQGALAVECCSENNSVLEILQSLNHCPTVLRVVAERSFLRALGGGCSAPVAVCTNLEEEHLTIVGAVWSLDGRQFLQKKQSVTLSAGLGEPARKMAVMEPKSHVGISARNIAAEDLEAAEKLGIGLADELIKEGALTIISEAKLINEKGQQKLDALTVPVTKNGTSNSLADSEAIEEKNPS